MKIVMNLFLFLVTAVFASPVWSGGGGVSGGSKMITVQVCDLDMPVQCHSVRFIDRFTDQDRENAIHQKPECFIPVGEAQYAPCDEKKIYEIPKFLKKLNELFGGTTAPPNNDPPN